MQRFSCLDPLPLLQRAAISDHLATSKPSSVSLDFQIYQWIVSNRFVADILSMGEIISDISDLTIAISAEEVLSWTDEAMEILKEKNTASGR